MDATIFTVAVFCLSSTYITFVQGTVAVNSVFPHESIVQTFLEIV